MARQILYHLIAQFGLLLSLCMLAGFCGVVTSAVVGGVGMAAFPEQSFGMVERLVCPADTHITYYEVTRSYHRPGESEPHVECVSSNGERQDKTLAAIFTVFGLDFAVVFLAVLLVALIPLSILAFLRTRKAFR